MKSTLKYILILQTVFLLSCSDDVALTKEQLLYQSIDELENRFEERKLGRIIEYVSKDYHDEQGRKIKDIKRAIQMQLMRHKSLHVFSVVKEITWTGQQKAKVNITAAMGGKPMTSKSFLTAIRADMINFQVVFVLQENIYKVKSATWTWADPSDFL